MCIYQNNAIPPQQRFMRFLNQNQNEIQTRNQMIMNNNNNNFASDASQFWCHALYQFYCRYRCEICQQQHPEQNCQKWALFINETQSKEKDDNDGSVLQIAAKPNIHLPSF